MTLRPLFSHLLMLESKSERQIEATESWLLSLPPHAACCIRTKNGKKVAVWLCQVIWVCSYLWTMRRKTFWVRTGHQWSFDVVPPYGPVAGLFLGCLRISILLCSCTAHITAGFHHVVAAPSFPLDLVDQGKETHQNSCPRGKLWRLASLVSVSTAALGGVHVQQYYWSPNLTTNFYFL